MRGSRIAFGILAALVTGVIILNAMIGSSEGKAKSESPDWSAAAVSWSLAQSPLDEISVHHVISPPLHECEFHDDFGRGTTVTIDGSNWTFSSEQGLNAEGLGRVFRFRDRVFLAGVDPYVSARVIGVGVCPLGPGRFFALFRASPPVSPPLPRISLLRLVDVTPAP
jgi:hypothetical protein